MNFHPTRSALALGLIVCWAINAEAQNAVIHASQVLPGGSRCDNVIQLMHLHGVNNSVDLAMSTSMLPPVGLVHTKTGLEPKLAGSLS